MRIGISDESATPSSHFLQERIEKERLPRSTRLPLKRFLSKIGASDPSRRCNPRTRGEC